MQRNKKAILAFAFSMLVSLSVIQAFEISGQKVQTNKVAGAVGGYLATGEASGAAIGALGGAATAGVAILSNAATSTAGIVCPWCAVGAVLLGA